MYRCLAVVLCLATAVPAAAGVINVIHGVNVPPTSLISGVTVTASSEFLMEGWHLTANNLVNGSGLSDGNHGTCYSDYTCWQNAANGFPATLNFDLGAVYDISQVHIWNGYWGSAESGRSAYHVDVRISSDGSNWFGPAATIFDPAPSIQDNPYAGFDLALTLGSARYVEFTLNDIWGGGSCGSCVTMAEVQFYSYDTVVPEPMTLGLSLVGLSILFFLFVRPRPHP